MTDIETHIRKAVIERVDRAPMAPSIESIDTLDRANLPSAHHRPPRGVLVGAGLLALVALFAVVTVAVRSQSPDRVSVGTDAAPTTVRTPLAGRTLPARFGLPNGLPGLNLVTEFDRPIGVATTDVAWLPTGPLGPLYAQSFHPPYDASAPVLEDRLGVLTVLPEDLPAVVASASGGGPSHATTVGSRTATITEPFSVSDDRVVSWQQDGAAIVVVAPSSLDDAGLLEAAAQVTAIPHIPLLSPLPVDGNGSGRVYGFYSLAPGYYVAPDPAAPTQVTEPWSALDSRGPLALAMGTLMDSITVDGNPVSIREVGDPAAHILSIASVAFNGDTGAVIWDTDDVTFSAGRGDASMPHHFPVYGSTPADTATVRLGLDDGTTIEGPTYDIGRGWPVRGYALVVPDTRQVVHLEARSSDGTVLYSGSVAWFDGGLPSADNPGGVANIGRCGSTASSYVGLDC